METPANIATKAIQLLEKADWFWSNTEKAFIEARNPDEETTEEYRSRPLSRISYEEIRDHGLTKSASESDQEIGLQWLHKRLTSSK
jgi:hypothetical protein